MKKITKTPELRSWISLNEVLREASEDICKILLNAELKGRNRKTFVKRIHSRLNKVRADRERVELGAV